MWKFPPRPLRAPRRLGAVAVVKREYVIIQADTACTLDGLPGDGLGHVDGRLRRNVEGVVAAAAVFGAEHAVSAPGGLPAGEAQEVGDDLVAVGKFGLEGDEAILACGPGGGAVL